MLSFLYGPTLTSIHDYWKTIALAIWTSVSNVMSLFFNMLSRFFIAFLPRTKQNYSSSIIHLVHSPPSFLPYHSLEKHKENKIQKKKKKENKKRRDYISSTIHLVHSPHSLLSYHSLEKEKKKEKKKTKKKTLHTLCSIHEPPIQRKRPQPLCFLSQSQILLSKNKTI